MSHKGTLVLATFLIGSAALPAVAHDGMVPVFGPTFIGASGKYHLTANITAPGPVITIGPGATDVDLDLNGFTITETTGGSPVIDIPGPGPGHLVIHNGTLTGGSSAIEIPAGFAGALSKVVLEELKVHDVVGPIAIHLGEVASAVIRKCEIASGGILWDGVVPSKSGTIEDNVIRAAGGGIFVTGCASLAIVSNRLQGIGMVDGIALSSCTGSLVAENTISGAAGDGIFLRGCKTMKLFDNVVTGAGCSGIHLDPGTLDTLVWKNNLSANGFAPIPPCGLPAGDGILVEADRTHVEGNTVNGNARMGIHFSGPGSVPPNPGASCFNSFGLNSTVGNLGPVAPCVSGPAAPVPPDTCFAVPAGGCGIAGPGSTSGGHNVKGGFVVY